MTIKLKKIDSGAVDGLPADSDPQIPPWEDDNGTAPETFECDFCGHCSTPNECAWSRKCPVCGAPAGEISQQTYCKTPTGGITGLHAERWENAS